MSWWISLKDPETEAMVEVPHFTEGSTYVIGGQTEADLNVTWNYGRLFRFAKLDGLTGEQALAMMEPKLKKLGAVRDTDYWAVTPGNVGHASSVLVAWVKQYPDAIFHVD